VKIVVSLPFFAPPDGVNTVPTDDNNDDLTNRLVPLELHRVGVAVLRTDRPCIYCSSSKAGLYTTMHKNITRCG